MNALPPIAIIGIGCRFPGANNPLAFWNILLKSVDAIREVPADRWDSQSLYDQDASTPGKTNSRWGGFLDAVDQFDPQMFGIATREATFMDPQQRLLLEVAWEALEDAGHAPERLHGTKTGVFVGIGTNDYSLIQPTGPQHVNAYWSTGNSLCIAANRLSYVFDLRGPSLAMDTGCSSSLVAVHYACHSLRAGECGLAIVGGVNVMLSPNAYINFSLGGALAADGRCKPFDARADGIVRGEGAGVVILKPLDRAQEDHDPIYAVIRGSAINQDGHSNGITAPNRLAQEAVLRAAYRDAGIPPARVEYVETHGTGTFLGDPIEAKALGRVVGAGRRPDQACAIGSVKSNIGHLEAAAGIASLIKVALALKEGAIPPSLHFREPNPNIPFEQLRLQVQQRLGSWSDAGPPSVAGVSSFGFGGTNVHVVLEKAPAPRENKVGALDDDDDQQLLPLSGHTEEVLEDVVERWIDYLASDVSTHEHSLPDVCYTAGARRGHHDHRLSVIGRNREELVESLRRFLAGDAGPELAQGARPASDRSGAVFVFSGQGMAWRGVGEKLFRREEAFRQSLEHCDQVLSDLTGWSVIDRVLRDQTIDRSELDRIQISTFALQVALADLWKSWGIKPEALIGHSMGEVTAAHVAGVLSLSDAAQVIYHRSRLMKQELGSHASHGAMALVRMSYDEAQQAVETAAGRVWIGASNSPTSTVLSGDADAIKDLVQSLKKRRIAARMLDVPGAGHAAHASSLKQQLIQSLRDIQPGRAAVPLYSSVRGQLTEGGALDADYWGRNLTEPVLFSQGVAAILDDEHDVFLEISRHPVLTGGLSDSFRRRGCTGAVLHSLTHDEDPRHSLLKALGKMYAIGMPVDWNGLFPAGRSCVRLPPYSWRRRRFWFDTGQPGPRRGELVSAPQPAGRGAVGGLWDQFLRSAVEPYDHYWQVKLDSQSLSGLSGCRREGVTALPPSILLEMALEGAEQALGEGPCCLEDVTFPRSLFLPEEVHRTVQMVMGESPSHDASLRFVIVEPNPAVEKENTTTLMTGNVQTLRAPSVPACRDDRDAVQARCPEIATGREVYAWLAAGAVEVSPELQCIQEIRWSQDEAVGLIDMPSARDHYGDGVGRRMALLDAGLTALGAVLGRRDGHTHLPVTAKSLQVFQRPADDSAVWCHLMLHPHSTETSAVGDIVWVDQRRQVLMRAEAVVCERLTVYEQTANLTDWTQTVMWQRQPIAQTARIAAARGVWLIFCDSRDVGEKLVGLLESRGACCVRITRGTEYQRRDANTYQVDAAQPEHFVQLWRDVLTSTTGEVVRAVHLWNLDVFSAHDTTPHNLDESIELGCGTLLHLVQATLHVHGNQPPPLWVITQGAQPVLDQGPELQVAQAPAWGFSRTLAMECSSLWGGIIDLDPDASGDDSATALQHELTQTDLGEDQIAYRGGTRYVARLVRRPCIAPPSRERLGRAPEPDGEHSGKTDRTSGPARMLSKPSQVNQGRLPSAEGAYLLVGGLGELGLVLADWLVNQGARHIVLMGRTALPRRAEWPQLPPHHGQAQVVAAVRKLEAKGARVRTYAVDVADEAQLGQFLRAYRDQGEPSIRGVFHLAGAADGACLADLDVTRLKQAMRAKVIGSWLLHRALADEALDCFVLFSSGSAILGSPFLASYAAGNAFLDSLAHYRAAQGQVSLSINWGFWKESGMAARALREAGRGTELQGMLGMSNTQALRILGHLMHHHPRQAIVVHFDWRKWFTHHAALAGTPLLANILPQASSSRRPAGQTRRRAQLSRQTLLDCEPTKRAGLLERFLREEIGLATGTPPSAVRMNGNLTNVGLDSLMAIELRNRIEAELEIEIPMTRFLRGGMPELIAGMVEQLHQAPRTAPTEGETQPSHRPTADEVCATVDTVADAQQLLGQLDHLSDKEVTDLLRSRNLLG